MWPRLAAVCAAALLVAAVCVPASYSAEPAGAKEIVLRLVFPDGQPAKGASAIVGGRSLVADGDGIVKATWAPARPGLGVASGEVVRLEGGLFGLFRKQVRYAGFLTIDPGSAFPLELRLTLRAVPDMDVACRSCHPEKTGGRGALIKCSHRSGIPLKQAQAVRVEQFNSENDELRKAGKPAYARIVVEEGKDRRWFSDKKMYLACRSCHSNHVDTGQRAYVLMPFAEKSILCKGCHV